jgi:predicted transposase/invertase (TIGR01784 family)
MELCHMSINEYDRIMKENIEPVLLPFAQKLLGLQGAKYTSIKDDLHVTIERKPDFLKKVRESENTRSYILQIEFQSTDEKDMVYRMLEYKSLLLRKFKVDVKQVVLYIGKDNLRKMTSSLETNGLSFTYEIVDIKSFNYEDFLKSDTPEEVILAILCNFRNTSPQKVIAKVLEKLRELLKGENRFGKYLKQLEVLSKLRDLQVETIKQTSIMPIVYDLETDIRFMQGEAKGEAKAEARVEQTRIETAKELLLLNILSIAQISQITKLSIDKLEALQKQTLNS